MNTKTKLPSLEVQENRKQSAVHGMAMCIVDSIDNSDCGYCQDVDENCEYHDALIAHEKAGDWATLGEGMTGEGNRTDLLLNAVLAEMVRRDLLSTDKVQSRRTAEKEYEIRTAKREANEIIASAALADSVSCRCGANVAWVADSDGVYCGPCLAEGNGTVRPTWDGWSQMSVEDRPCCDCSKPVRMPVNEYTGSFRPVCDECKPAWASGERDAAERN